MNADDPVACLEAARLAWEYRVRFGLDFLIDLVGYRRYGHNEGDEPSFTQPMMYKAIASHPTVREQWARTLVDKGSISPELPEALVRKHFDDLEATYAALKPEQEYVPPLPSIVPPGTASKVTTGVPVDRLREINDALLARPAGFTFHRKLERGMERRRAAFANPDERSIDWATAEELALATILVDGTAIRMLLKTAVLPVKWIPARSGESSRMLVICAASPGTKLITPGGRPARSSSRTM